MSRFVPLIFGSMSGRSFRLPSNERRLPSRAAIVILFSLALAVSASTEGFGRSIVRDCQGIYDLCGTIDATTGEEIIPRRYEDVSSTGEGLTAVQTGGLWGLIDAAGNVVVQPRFDGVSGYHRGLAAVRMDGRIGVVDRSGKFVVEPRFARAVPLTEDAVAVSDVAPTRTMSEFGLGSLDHFEDWRLLRIGGTPSEALYELKIFDDDSDLIWAKPKGSNLYGLLHVGGTWRVEPVYSEVDGLSDGRAVVSIPDGSVDGSRREAPLLQGAVDEQGHLVIRPQRWRLFFWSRGYGRVEKDGRSGLLDRDGHLLGERWFDAVENASIHPYPLVKVDGDWFGIDPRGRLVKSGDAAVKMRSCAAGHEFHAVVRGFEVRSPDGRKIVTGLTDRSDWRDFSCGELIRVSSGPPFRDDERWGFLGRDGHLLGGALPFERATPFSNGHALVRVGGKWGLIDETGRYTIEPRHDWLQPAGAVPSSAPKEFGLDGRWLVDETYKNNERNWTYFQTTFDDATIGFDVNGKEQLLPPKPTHREMPLWCNGGAKLRPVGGLWGMFDEHERPVLEGRYRALTCFIEGVAWVAIDERREWCAIGPDGRIRDRPACQRAWYPRSEYTIRSKWDPKVIRSTYFPEPFSDDEYESSVAWNRAYLEYAAGLRDETPCFIIYGVRCGTHRSGF